MGPDNNLRIINDFFNTDSRIKSDIVPIFMKYGEIQFDDFSNQLINYLCRKLELMDNQVEQIRYDKRLFIKAFLDNYLKCVESFGEHLNGIKITPEEILDKSYSITEDSIKCAELYIRKLSLFVDQLNDKDIVRRNSNSDFSYFATQNLDWIRNYIGENFGGAYVRRFEYYCESDLKDDFDYTLRIVLSSSSREISFSLGDFLSVINNMKTDQIEQKQMTNAEALLL